MKSEDRQTAEARISGAENDATYLLAAVEVVGTYRLYNINRRKLERHLHRMLAPAQLDIQVPDRFGHAVRPREWFLAPLPVIDQAVSRLQDGTVEDIVYDPSSGRLREA